MTNLRISEILIYPIKSLGAVTLTSAKIEKRGLEHDRRWMLVDENNIFLSQRKCKEMALLKVRLHENGLEISHQFLKHLLLHIPFDAKPLELIKVQIWEDTCDAHTISDDINHWFSTVLGVNCKLVYMPDDSNRQVDIRYAEEGDLTSFADGFPILIIGQAALDKLNTKLVNPVEMNRFRPNIVFTGGQPNEEDEWKIFKIGDTTFYGVKPCARCMMTTINQQNAEQGEEPLKTLASYRKKDNKILFGQNVIAESAGKQILVGDIIEVLKN